MLPNEDSSSGPYSGDRRNTSFVYDFLVSDKDNIEVRVTRLDGSKALLVVDRDFSVSGIGDVVGGTVTFPVSGSIHPVLAPGDTLFILRAPPFTQEVNLSTLGQYRPDTIEYMVDQVVKQTQYLLLQLGLHVEDYEDLVKAVAANLVKILANTASIAALRVHSDQMDAALRGHSDQMDAALRVHSDQMDAALTTRVDHNLDLINNIHLILEGHDPRITENREAILVLFTITEVLEKGILENRGLIVDNANDIVDNANDIGDLQHTTHLINSLIHDMYQCCVDFKYQLSHFTLDQIIDVYTTNAKDHDLLVRMNGGWQAMTPPGFATGVDWTPGMSFARNTIYNPKVQAAGEHLAVVLATPLTQHIDGVTQHLRITVSEPTDITFASEFKVVPLITTTGSYNLTFHYIGGIVHVDVSKAEAGFGRGGFGSGKFGLPLT